MTWPLRQKWFWILFGFLCLVVLLPFIVVYLVFTFTPTLWVLILVVLAGIWFVVRVYRHRQQEEAEAGENEQAGEGKLSEGESP